MAKDFTLNGCTLINANCFDVVPELDVKADCCISDLPFGITDLHWDRVPPLDQFWTMVKAKTKRAANYVLFAAGKFTVDLVNSQREWYRYDMVWSKNNKCGFLWSKYQPLRSHESILIFTQPGEFKNATYNPQKIPGGRIGSKRISRKSSGVYGITNGYVSKGTGMMHPSSVLCFDNDRQGNQQCFHPTQKPIQLMQWLVATFTNPGDTVLDPFGGSGSTALACLALGRKAIVIEKDPVYYEIAVERLKTAQHTNLFINNDTKHDIPTNAGIVATAS